MDTSFILALVLAIAICVGVLLVGNTQPRDFSRIGRNPSRPRWAHARSSSGPITPITAEVTQ